MDVGVGDLDYDDRIGTILRFTGTSIPFLADDHHVIRKAAACRLPCIGAHELMGEGSAHLQVLGVVPGQGVVERDGEIAAVQKPKNGDSPTVQRLALGINTEGRRKMAVNVIMARRRKLLPIPPVAANDPKSQEMIRAWIADTLLDGEPTQVGQVRHSSLQAE